MMALALWLGACAIAGRPLRTPRASVYMMEGASIFRQPAFLLGKPDLPVAREAVGPALEQSVVTVAPLPEPPVPPAALAHVSDASTTVLAATSSSGGAFPLLPVVLVALPALLYFVILPRLDGVVVVVLVVVHPCSCAGCAFYHSGIVSCSKSSRPCNLLYYTLYYQARRRPGGRKRRRAAMA